MLLIEYKGAEFLPKKKTSIGPMGDDERDMLVFNEAVSKVEKVGISIECEYVAMYLHEFKEKTYKWHETSRCNREWFRRMAKYIIERQKEWLSLEVVE